MIKKEQLNFKLKINGEPICSFDKTDKCFNFIVENVATSMKNVCKKYNIEIECEECKKIVIIKNLQQLIKTNKPFLCKSCRILGSKNPMFGKKHSEKTKEILKKNNSGESNPFYKKKHSEDSKLKQSKAKIGLYDGKKNPMYGKNVLDIWIEKYGYEEAILKWIGKGKKHSTNMSGQKNPMYKKNIVDIWIEKYGYDKANNIYENWKINIKDALLIFYKNNPELRKTISDKMKNREFSENHKKNLRLSSIEYIKKKLQLNGGKLVPHFNIEACKLFEEISLLKKINIQHALNGGEFYIKQLGYWVDGYDKENNVVYEYYEREHNYKIERDLIREEQIKKLLNCEFIIIKENQEYEYLKKIKNEI